MDKSPRGSDRLIQTAERAVTLNRTILRLTGVELAAHVVWSVAEPIADRLLDYVIDKTLSLALYGTNYPGSFSPEKND